MKHHTFKQYPENTRIKIIATGEKGEANESVLGFISVFLDGEKKEKIYPIEKVRVYEK